MPRYREWDLACKVYVGNLGSSASKYEIENAFQKYGPLRNVWVARNPPGFAFVEFEDRRDAEDATRGLDGTRCCGTRIRVEMSSGRSRRDDRRGGGRGAGGAGGSRGGGSSGGRYRPNTTSAPNCTSLSATATADITCSSFYKNDRIYNSNLTSHICPLSITTTNTTTTTTTTTTFTSSTTTGLYNNKLLSSVNSNNYANRIVTIKIFQLLKRQRILLPPVRHNLHQQQLGTHNATSIQFYTVSRSSKTDTISQIYNIIVVVVVVLLKAAAEYAKQSAAHTATAALDVAAKSSPKNRCHKLHYDINSQLCLVVLPKGQQYHLHQTLSSLHLHFHGNSPTLLYNLSDFCVFNIRKHLCYTFSSSNCCTVSAWSSG